MYRLGLVGKPVIYSNSPAIHEHFLKNMGEVGTYNLFDVKENELQDLLAYATDEGYTGLNVTAPYKEKIIPFLDELDSYAKEMGSVNTIKWLNGKRIGYNTDGVGFVNSLKQHAPLFFEKPSLNVLMLGAGGAAKGIALALKSERILQIDIANRTTDNARILSEKLPSSNVIDLKEAERNAAYYDLIIQTTTVGMAPNPNEQIIQLDKLNKRTIVSDIIYQPHWTMFLKDANKQGASVLFGIHMLIQQAAKSFEIWTGHRPNTDQLDWMKEG